MPKDEQMVTVSTPNKKTASDEIFETYFSYTDSKKYCVSYLLIIETSKETKNTLDKLILQIHNAMSDLDEITYQRITNKNKFSIQTESTELTVKINSEESEKENELLWEVSFEGDFKFLESFREKFLTSIKDICEKKYCLQDEISDEICVVAYPKVRQLENILREYLLRFFSKKFGSKWWKENSNKQLETKLKDRSGRAFNGILDMELFSIDFIDLTQLLDAKSQMEGHELIEALDNIVRSREDVEKFNQKIERVRNRYLGNWKKFFESHIKIDNFLKTWKDLYEIRCEVAHNALINLSRFSRLIILHTEIRVQLNKLIDDLRVIKTDEYALLDRILSLEINFSKEDIKSIIDRGILHITPQNFNEEALPVEIFNELILKSKEDLKLIGEYNSSEIQLNTDEDTLIAEEPISSVSISIHYSEVTNLVKGALMIGLGNNKFL
ncbi:hypothetical protein EDM56_16175 [Brevibacillus fluminis]|uniref:Apea-like HEPN domain-containing protein n=1 Tax=Brevibacillus fluminis TaxID=511487 RepID=A0A3M8DGK0_9BACL|nr:hypothetical protein [Brevibacillus fluminis]RNB87213.1 hypothetical protein EDM56_16175 [Brevibacillus fluminis]